MYCPDCGRLSLEVIERIPPGDELNADGGFKLICTCSACENMVYVFRDAEPVSEGRS